LTCHDCYWWRNKYVYLCVCLRIVVSNTYCVVFLFCFSSSCVPCFQVLWLSPFFDWPFGIL
jgi:hypothetical protein